MYVLDGGQEFLHIRTSAMNSEVHHGKSHEKKTVDISQQNFRGLTNRLSSFFRPSIELIFQLNKKIEFREMPFQSFVSPTEIHKIKLDDLAFIFSLQAIIEAWY